MNTNHGLPNLSGLLVVGCCLIYLNTVSSDDCPNAPLSGAWNFEAGKMTVGGQFTPLGGGKVSAQLAVIDCGIRINATIDTVGSLSFRQIDGSHYSADRLPPGFSEGIHWDLRALSPTELMSQVYFDEPTQHLQAHLWTYAEDAGATTLPDDSQPVAGVTPPDKLKIKQGVWGYVTPGLEIGWFADDQTGLGGVHPTVCTPPDADGFYQLPFEPGEMGWFCMVQPPCSEAQLRSDCVHWEAVEGLKYCGLDGAEWNC